MGRALETEYASWGEWDESSQMLCAIAHVRSIWRSIKSAPGWFANNYDFEVGEATSNDIGEKLWF